MVIFHVKIKKYLGSSPPHQQFTFRFKEKYIEIIDQETGLENVCVSK